MKRLSNKTNINKGQEVPSINLNLQTEAAQYLVQQGQAKEGGGGEARKTSIHSFYFSFINAKIKNTYKQKYADNKNQAKGTMLYNHQKNSRMNKVNINPNLEGSLA